MFELHGCLLIQPGSSFSSHVGYYVDGSAKFREPTYRMTLDVGLSSHGTAVARAKGAVDTDTVTDRKAGKDYRKVSSS